MKQKTIGFFGGTFDPIHFGHINLAIQLRESHGLDEVLFCPAFRSPLKEKKPPFASEKDRLAMLRLALEGIADFLITDYEILKKEVSYTIDTMQFLIGNSRGEAFRLLLSEESVLRFDQWKKYQELIRLAPPLIGVRAGFSTMCKLENSLFALLRPGFTSTKIFEVSSTEIRERLQKGLYCGHLVPTKALDYIQSHNLYTG